MGNVYGSAEGEIEWTYNYIANRYGNPSNARAFWNCIGLCGGVQNQQHGIEIGTAHCQRWAEGALCWVPIGARASLCAPTWRQRSGAGGASTTTH
jgi:hypothetical protein